MPDHARPLNSRGQQAVAAMRVALGHLGVCPGLLLVSTARRTRETASALEPWPVPPRVEATDTLYLASAATLLGALQELPDDTESVMMVAHNPGLHELALSLIGEQLTPANSDMRRISEGYPSGALAEFAVPGSWAGLRDGGARLVRFICPRDLPVA